MSDSTSAMPNGFDILKKMWEAFSPPATFTSPLTQLMQSAAPLLDPNEIENRIAEMRAVEQWLTLNLNVLRSTIQAFEVQRATYATLRAFGNGGFGAAPSGESAGFSQAAAGAAGAEQAASAFSQFAQAGGNFWRSPFAGSEPAQDVESQAHAPEPEPEPEPEAEPEPAEAANEPPQGGQGAAGAESPFAQASNAYGALDPSMWFNAMRAQFDQIAAAAQAAGVSATHMTEAAAAQMSEAAASATKATQAATKAATDAATDAAKAASGRTASAAGKTAGKTAGKAAGKTAASKSSKQTASAGGAKTAAKAPAKSAKAAKSTPSAKTSQAPGKAPPAVKSAEARTSAKSAVKAPAKRAGKTTPWAW
ncbi:PhaM family polyhydroxyalkanoate granule multifunctional regulatory protein [Pandoraea sp. PE-S2T-3]|uniref:PhaM family polyhydroxyalkanoate granule multifunctional regulatory protein n=1 Tax=Pandoraea sp. PE-S2T-3 TaxID=1986993 RepID=UPI000B405374|nr:PhaM family polyhydroxyalkanoate granule multifunctional regulatory protein [Pandoraea sp. PE-S2T-3]